MFLVGLPWPGEEVLCWPGRKELLALGLREISSNTIDFKKIKSSPDRFRGFILLLLD